MFSDRLHLLRHACVPRWCRTGSRTWERWGSSLLRWSIPRSIPLPLPGSTDLLLLWLVAHSGDPWLLAPCAIAGSILGGYTTWHIGRRGGEEALRSYVPARLLGRIVGGSSVIRILAVFLPALLPPPIPLLPFALASGALGVSRRRFLAVFGAARSLRYSFIAWLGVTYGRRIVRMWSGTLQTWSTPLLCVFVGLLVSASALGYGRYAGCVRWRLLPVDGCVVMVCPPPGVDSVKYS